MQNDTTATAVCIGLDADDPPSDLRGAFARFRCIHYRDVYRALARVGRDQPAVVIIDVGWLPSAAFEIFDVLARSHVGLPVLVTGPARAQARIRDALARGAMALATADAITACLPAGPPAGPAARQVSAPASRRPLPGEGEESSDTFASAGNVFDAALDERLNEQLDTELIVAAERTAGVEPVGAPSAPEPDPEENVEDSLDEPEATEAWDADEAPVPTDEEASLADEGIRVPWRRYMDRPRRTPPQRTPPQRTPPATRGASAPARPTASSPPARTGLDAPLLSEAELAALLSPLRRGRKD